MISDLTLPGSNISFWRAQVALERQYRNDVEIHLDYMVTSSGYWPAWAERPTFQSKIVQEWIEARSRGPVDDTWLERQAQRSNQTVADIKDLHTHLEASVREHALAGPWQVSTAVIPVEPGHHVYGEDIHFVDSVLGDDYPLPQLTLTGKIPRIERWPYVRYITTVTSKRWGDVLGDISVTIRSEPLPWATAAHLDEIARKSESTLIELFLASQVSDDDSLGEYNAERLARTFAAILTTIHTQEVTEAEDGKHVHPAVAAARAAIASAKPGDPITISGGKVAINITDEQIRTLGELLNAEDPIRTIVDASGAFPEYSEQRNQRTIVLRWPYFFAFWMPTITNILTAVTDAGAIVSGVLGNGGGDTKQVWVIRTVDGAMQAIETPAHGVLASLANELNEHRMWTDAYGLNIIAPKPVR